MKMYLLTLAAILMVSGYAFALDTESTVDSSSGTAIHGTNPSDHVTLNDGKTLSTVGGVTSPLGSETTMSNGTIVKPGGTYQLQEGGSVNSLKNGETLNADGMVTKEDKPKATSAH